MSPQDFVAMQGIAPRVSRAPEVVATCTPEVAVYPPIGSCECKACQRAKLNPDPADYLIAKMVRLRATGKSPGNPKWYRVPTLPRFEFKPNQPPVFPAWTYR